MLTCFAIHGQSMAHLPGHTLETGRGHQGHPRVGYDEKKGTLSIQNPWMIEKDAEGKTIKYGGIFPEPMTLEEAFGLFNEFNFEKKPKPKKE